MAATRASDADRDSCLEDIEAAFADGRIDDSERESRTQAALQATTVTQLQALVEDLAPTSFVPAQGTPRSFGHAPGGATRAPTPVVVPPRVLGAVLAVALVAAALSVVIWWGARGDDDSVTAGTPGSAVRPDAPDDRLALHTVAGFEQLVELTRATFGSTVVDDAAIYPDYASVEIVLASDARRTERWFFGRGYEGDPSKGTRPADAIDVDLADVDAATLVRAIRRAPAVLGVEDVDQTYVVISAAGGQPAYSVYVSNEYHETGWYQFAFDGTELYRSEFE